MSDAEWPSSHLSAEEVRAWIAQTAPGHPAVVGPTRVLQAKDWGVTAAFAIDPAPYPEPEVVFKACYVPLYRDAPRLAELLHRAGPGLVPEPLARRQDDRQTWTIFRPFRGPTVQSVGTVPALVDLARTMAHVQATVGARPAAVRGLSHLPVRAIP